MTGRGRRPCRTRKTPMSRRMNGSSSFSSQRRMRSPISARTPDSTTGDPREVGRRVGRIRRKEAVIAGQSAPA
eukprot:982056-Heterocapsa_arctica.AAC.1